MHHESDNKFLRAAWNICLFTFLFLFISAGNSSAQWVGNSEKNTLLVTNCFNPVNISLVADGKGGMFIFWEDNLTGFQNDVHFLHVNGDGIVSFRSDGKKISASDAPKTLPVSCPALPNSSYVVWKERTPVSEQIFAQRVSTAGTLMWNQFGIPVNKPGDPIGDYSACSDKSGTLFISHIPKDPDVNNDYIIKLQSLTPEGNKIFKESLIIARSPNKKSNISCVSDGTGGAYILWLESIDSKSVLLVQKIEQSGKLKWGSNPIALSSMTENVFFYSSKNMSTSLYAVWQSQRRDKDIYHQIIDSEGKFKWQKYGLQVMPSAGNQTNPQPLIKDNEIFLTWTDESQGDRNILLQKFSASGENLFEHNGIPVIALKGDQFGQKILSDGEKGIIVTWIDRRINELRGNIYAQRMSRSGQKLWDPNGIAVAKSKNTEKSYVSVIPDITGGVAVVFKEKRAGKNEIFGQKIFNTGTFTSQIIAFKTELTGDSVKVSWYSANESAPCTFSIERTTSSDTSENTWQKIGEKNSDGKAAARYYEFYDNKPVSGSLIYRVVHSDLKGNIQPSDMARINYLGENSVVFVQQNEPNPFTEKTNIKIFFPSASEAKIEFFDSHLEKIQEIKQNFPAGESKIEFSAAGLQPGIYFYKVHCEDFIDVKKMVVTR